MFKRGKYSGTGTYRNQSLPIFHSLPFIQPFTHRKCAVEYSYSVAVPFMETADGLGRERNFRHHNDNAFSLLIHFINQLHKHKGFSTACNTVKQ